MIIFFILNIIVGVSAWMLAVRCKRNSLADICIDWFCFYFALIVVSEIILGIFGILRLEYLVAVHLAAAIFIYAFVYRKKAAGTFIDAHAAVNEIFRHKAAVLIASILFAFGCVKLSINLVNPPFGWDCLNYHFTFPVEWLKAANLNNPMTVSCDPSPPYYPINGSLFFFWLMVPLRNVFMADLGQLPFFIISIVALFSIARKLGLSREYAFYAAGLFALIPNYFKQLEIAYVDIMVGALFVVAWHYLFVLEKKYSIGTVSLFSMTLGLLIGIKTLALSYSFLLLPPFFYLVFRQNNKKLSNLLVFTAAVVALGGFSYIRNYFLTANPFYPVDVDILGFTIFQGVRDKVTYTIRFSPEDYHLSKLLFHEGLSGQGPLFMLLPIFIALPLAIIKKRLQARAILAYFLINPILLYCVYYFMISLPNSRYLYPLFGLAMILGFLVIDMLRIPRPVVVSLVVISALAAMSTLANHRELVTGILCSLSLFAIILFIRKRYDIKRFFSRRLLIALAVILLVGLIFCNSYYNRNEYPRYSLTQEYSGFDRDATDAWDWINKHTDGDTIAYVGEPWPFPLYGENFKNNVCYVSVNAIEPAKLHFYANSRYSWGEDFLDMHQNFEAKGNYRGGADYQIWLGNLKKRHVRYLVVYSLNQVKTTVFPLEDSWALQHQDVFEPVFNRKTVHIYQVKAGSHSKTM